jgi:ABC-type lipoprotein export system ATPase subunit
MTPAPGSPTEPYTPATEYKPGAELVVCDRLSRRYGSGVTGAVYAVREVSVAVRTGMRVALTGPSGSGKSTLLHLIAGLDQPSSGTVSWPGLCGPPPPRPGAIGIVFQGPSLLPDLDTAENVALPLLFDDTTSTVDAAAHADEALHRLGIGELAGKLPDQLSGGQAQRVAIARAVAGRPRLILADEPTGQLDHRTGAVVIDALLETAGALGAALVVATHDPRVADRLAARWSMTDGRLVVPEGSLSCSA